MQVRHLVKQDAGCLDVTQFVGVIPPGRAPEHSNSDDEVVYIIDGVGILHLGGEQRVIGPGSAMHLRHSPSRISRTQERGLCEY
jgi:quercetin dioxygenase-like cupin family protein